MSSKKPGDGLTRFELALWKTIRDRSLVAAQNDNALLQRWRPELASVIDYADQAVRARECELGMDAGSDGRTVGGTS